MSCRACSCAPGTSGTWRWTGARAVEHAPGPWPALDAVEDHDALLDRFDDLIPTPARRETPLVVAVVVAQDERFDP